MAFDTGGGGKKGRARPDMNVTPLVDVVLVLLIIFMVVTPMLAKQFWVHVPPEPEENEPPPPPDPDAPVDASRADASASLFGIGNQAFFFGRPPRPPVGDVPSPDQGTRLRSDGPIGAQAGDRAAEDFGRWRLLVQHQSGSLEAAVARARELKPDLVILDLDSARTQPFVVLQQLAADPELALIPTLGFVAHVHAAAIREARALGIGEVLARSAFVATLPDILSRGRS